MKFNPRARKIWIQTCRYVFVMPRKRTCPKPNQSVRGLNVRMSALTMPIKNCLAWWVTTRNSIYWTRHRLHCESPDTPFVHSPSLLPIHKETILRTISNYLDERKSWSLRFRHFRQLRIKSPNIFPRQNYHGGHLSFTYKFLTGSHKMQSSHPYILFVITTMQQVQFREVVS